MCGTSFIIYNLHTHLQYSKKNNLCVLENILILLVLNQTCWNCIEKSPAVLCPHFLHHFISITLCINRYFLSLSLLFFSLQNTLFIIYIIHMYILMHVHIYVCHCHFSCRRNYKIPSDFCWTNKHKIHCVTSPTHKKWLKPPSTLSLSVL